MAFRSSSLFSRHISTQRLGSPEATLVRSLKALPAKGLWFAYTLFTREAAKR